VELPPGIRPDDELAGEPFVERDRIEWIGKIVPALDTGGPEERLTVRLEVQEVLHFLQPKRRSNGHQLHDIDVRRLREHFDSHDRSLAMRHDRDGRLAAGQKILQPFSNRSLLRVVEQICRGVGDELLEERPRHRLADESRQRQRFRARSGCLAIGFQAVRAQHAIDERPRGIVIRINACLREDGTRIEIVARTGGFRHLRAGRMDNVRPVRHLRSGLAIAAEESQIPFELQIFVREMPADAMDVDDDRLTIVRLGAGRGALTDGFSLCQCDLLIRVRYDVRRRASQTVTDFAAAPGIRFANRKLHAYHPVMLGIRGLDGFGFLHALFGVAALLLGAAVFMMRKGTNTHRKVGLAYVLAMFSLNLTALWIFDLTGRFGPFHMAALISLATLFAGYAPARYRRPGQWVELHGIFMGWSYVGLVAGFLAEIAVRVPGVGFSPAVITATVISVVGGALLIHTRVPLLARRINRR